MKKLTLVLALVLIATTAQSAVVRLTFEWDANSETDLAGYRLYSSSQSGVYTKGNYIQSTGVVTTTTEEIDILPGEVVYFVLTAYDLDGDESGYSNEVSFFLPSEGPGIAPNPPNFRLRRWEVVSYE